MEQRNILEQSEREAKQHADSSLRELNLSRTKFSELESQSEILRLHIQEVKEDKNDLEKALIELNDQLLLLRGRERETLAAAEYDRKNEEEQKSLKEELVTRHQLYEEEILSLRSEIKNKEQLIIQLQE